MIYIFCELYTNYWHTQINNINTFKIFNKMVYMFLYNKLSKF